MNSLQTLGVLCAKCNECALELSCLQYCDPVLVLKRFENLKKNAIMCIFLNDRLAAALKTQLAESSMPIVLYLKILLENLNRKFDLIIKALCDFKIHKDKRQYFDVVLEVSRCHFHSPFDVVFVNGDKVPCNLDNFNTVERFLCKVNFIFPLLDATEGLRLCEHILQQLTKFYDTSPVMRYELYDMKSPCFACYEELQISPNNGCSSNKRMKNHVCDHIAPTVDASFVLHENDYLHILEQDLKGENLLTDTVINIIREAQEALLSKECTASVETTEAVLHDYNVFSKDIPDHIYMLSDLTYWSKVSEDIVKKTETTLLQLNVYNDVMHKLKTTIARTMYGCAVVDCFDVYASQIPKKYHIFLGSIFTSPSKIISILTDQCIKAFEGSAFFAQCNEYDEIFKSINTVLGKIKNGADSVHDDVLRNIHYTVQEYDVMEEVKARKKMYFDKVTEMGYSRINKALLKESTRLGKLINISMIGTPCLELLTKTMNMFTSRESVAKIIENGVNLLAMTGYDNHLYIKNNLARKKIPDESVAPLIQTIFDLVCGPLFTHRSEIFPMPGNIDMAYTCDNADILPHVKEDLMQCVYKLGQTSDWMISGYNKFLYLRDCSDINTAQKVFWGYIKELVVAVSLYNDIYGHCLTVKRIEDIQNNGLDFHNVVLTFNQDIPLLLKTKTHVIYGSDVYSLLYAHSRF